MFSKNRLFQLKNTTLGARVDLALEMLENDTYHQKKRMEALQFLIFIFDLNFQDNAKSLIKQILLMKENRDLYKIQNPEYIPNQAPKFLDDFGFQPEFRMIKPLNVHGKHVEGQDENAVETDPHPIVQRAIQDQELLDVCILYKRLEIDKENNVTYFINTHLINDNPEQPEEREQYRLLLKDGKFYREGKLFSSSKGISHAKPGTVAFIIDTNGHMYAFNHLEAKKPDKSGHIVIHSSMTGSAPVIAAGEFKIVNGELKQITTHSGHYQPSLFTIYRLLSYFDEKKVNLTDVNIVTELPIPESISKNCIDSTYSDAEGKKYLKMTPALDIFCNVKQLLNKSIQALDEYKKGDYGSHFSRTIGYTLGYKLAQERNLLAIAFSAAINKIINSDLLTPAEKINEIKDKVKRYSMDNDSLATYYRKTRHPGKLSQTFCLFQDAIDAYNPDKVENNLSPEMTTAYKKLY